MPLVLEVVRLGADLSVFNVEGLGADRSLLGRGWVIALIGQRRGGIDPTR